MQTCVYPALVVKNPFHSILWPQLSSVSPLKLSAWRNPLDSNPMNTVSFHKSSALFGIAPLPYLMPACRGPPELSNPSHSLQMLYTTLACSLLSVVEPCTVVMMQTHYSTLYFQVRNCLECCSLQTHYNGVPMVCMHQSVQALHKPQRH